ncbi:MAG: triose-phosphate isomerase [Patescibacteria group bacterium]|nr:triose-phosphate isomerase [Patescibacteria group bacterium]
MLIVANLKANNVLATSYQLLTTSSVEVAVAAPFPLIDTVTAPFIRAAQDVSAFNVGAHTGEVPARLLADLKVKYVLVGHSERRCDLHETNKEVEAKMSQAIAAGLIPILCAQNLEEIPANIRNIPADKYLIMYEPAQAISTQNQYHPESPEKINAVLTDWKSKLNFTGQFLYGGSVNADNVLSFLELRTYNLISGLVVGQASLDPESFAAIINQCQKIVAEN